VQVCPTGIDIRDGLQYECIGCAGCIDVCNQVMEKMDYPKGLIRYTTESAVRGDTTRILRPRIFVYAATLLVSITALGISISQRVPLELDVIRDRNALYRETNEGLVENIYTLKVINKDRERHQYRLEVSGPEGLELINKASEISVASGEVLSIPVSVRIDPVNLLKASTQIQFHIAALEREEIKQIEPARFLGPITR
jgi:cytochrome c oxidase accessory protein FixG